MSKAVESNSRGLVRSMMTIGSAQAINILLSVIRLKMLAVLLGPAGVGLLSIYNNLQDMVSKAAGVGLATSGVRELASAQADEDVLGRVRRVLFAAHLVQGALAMLGVWLLRDPISAWLFGNAEYGTEVGLVGLAILLTLLMSSQNALLQGLRRIGDLGRVTVLGSLGGTVVGLAAVWFYGGDGLIWFVLAQPLAGFGVALWFTRRLPKPTTSKLRLYEIWATWKPMARLGAAFMLSGLATAATLLLVRGHITQELGLAAAGQFAASWGITMTYVGFLLAAMGADYYPRLAEVIADHAAAIRLVNDQVQLGLAIGGPVLLLLIGLAPWVITLLYTDDFMQAARLLQWQTIGNILKLACWPLGFLIMAAAQSRAFLFANLNFNVIFILLLWLALPKLGIIAAGPAFLVAYLVHFLVLNLLVSWLNNFRWQKLSLILITLYASLATGLLILTARFPSAAAVVALALSGITFIIGARIVLMKVGPAPGIYAKVENFFDAIRWPIHR